MAITFSQVAQIMEAEAAEGRVPTQKRVRELLGGTGSLSTINTHMRAWRESQAPSEKPLPAEDLFVLSDEQAKAVARVIHSVAQGAIDAEKVRHNELLTIAKTEADNAVKSAEQYLSEKAEAQNRADRLEAELTQAKQKILELECRLELLQKEHEENRQKLEVALAEAAANAREAQIYRRQAEQIPGYRDLFGLNEDTPAASQPVESQQPDSKEAPSVS